MANRFSSPTNDIAFKKIFGTEEHKHLLISFLNATLELTGEKKIKTVSKKSNDLLVLVAGQKECFLDILVEDEAGTQYIVEVQVEKEDGFLKRMLHYASKTYSQELGVSDKYKKLKKVVSLAITKHILLPNHPTFKSTHLILEKDYKTNDFEDFCFVIIELPKFTKKASELETIEDKWCYFFKNAQTISEIDEAETSKNVPEIKEAFKTLEQHSWDPLEIYFYEKRERDEYQHIATLQEETEKALNHGIAEGMQKGIVEGKLEIAKNLFNKGFSFLEISQITGLSILELESKFKK